MTKKNLVLIPLLVAFSCFSKEFNIVDFGAFNDSSKLSSPAIQKAIDVCSEQGGGIVTVPAGNYTIGTIIIKDNVQLDIQNGATLWGSKNIKDYIEIKANYISLRTQTKTIQLIYAENAQNIAITGLGEIDGQGKYFPKLSWMDEGITRPHLIRFINCTDVKVKDISLKNSGCWMQHYLACTNVQITGLTIENHNNFNNDGLDIDGCKNVTISDIVSDTDDDGLVLKSTSARLCENITVSNCVFSSHCNGIKLGTETNGGFRNISITNCVVKPSKKDTSNFFGQFKGIGGIVLLIVDGGIMDRVTVSNIQIEGTECPIFVRLANRARPFKDGEIISNIGEIKNVLIDNIQVSGTKNIGCSLTGMPGHPLKNITLRNINIVFEGGGADSLITKYMPEKEAEYPEPTMFGQLPAYGFYIRHAEDISFNEIKLSNHAPDARPALFLEDVKLAKFKGSTFNAGKANNSAIVLKNVEDIYVEETRLLSNSKLFIDLLGDKNANIVLRNNNLINQTQQIVNNYEINKKLINENSSY